MNITDIEGFPTEEPNARLTLQKRQDGSERVYVTVEINTKDSAGKRIHRVKFLGRVVDGKYYSMEDYHRLFKRDGTLKSTEGAVKKRKYEMKKPWSERKPRKAVPYPEGVPRPEEIEGFPLDNPRARIMRNKQKTKNGEVTRFYVVERTYFRDNGKSRYLLKTLGRVVGKRFYSNEEYIEHFKRSGEERI